MNVRAKDASSQHTRFLNQRRCSSTYQHLRYQQMSRLPQLYAIFQFKRTSCAFHTPQPPPPLAAQLPFVSLPWCPQVSFLIVSVSQEHASSIIPDVVLPLIDRSSHEDGYAGLERSLAAPSIGRSCAACDVCGSMRTAIASKNNLLRSA